MRTLSDSTQKYKASLMLDPGEVIEGIADNPDRGEAKPFLSDSTQKYRKIYKNLNENPEAEFDLLLKMDPDDRAFFFGSISLINYLKADKHARSIFLLTIIIFIPTYTGIQLSLSSVAEPIKFYTMFGFCEINKIQLMTLINSMLILFWLMLFGLLSKEILKFHIDFVKYLISIPRYLSNIYKERVSWRLNRVYTSKLSLIKNFFAVLLMIIAFVVVFIIPIYLLTYFW